MQRSIFIVTYYHARFSARQDGPGEPGRGLHRGHDAQVQAAPVRPQRHPEQTEGRQYIVNIGNSFLSI